MDPLFLLIIIIIIIIATATNLPSITTTCDLPSHPTKVTTHNNNKDATWNLVESPGCRDPERENKITKYYKNAINLFTKVPSQKKKTCRTVFIKLFSKIMSENSILKIVLRKE